MLINQSTNHMEKPYKKKNLAKKKYHKKSTTYIQHKLNSTEFPSDRLIYQMLCLQKKKKNTMLNSFLSVYRESEKEKPNLHILPEKIVEHWCDKIPNDFKCPLVC